MSADNLLFDLAILEDEKGWNTADIETRAGSAVRIDIKLSDLDAALVLFSDCFDCRSDRAARCAPCCSPNPVCK